MMYSGLIDYTCKGIKMNKDIYYAPSEAHIKFAADNGYQKVVIDSRGHCSSYEIGRLNDNLLCMMREVPELYEIRKQFADSIKAQKQEVRRRVNYAKSLGLKVYFHSYEISMPPEVMEVFPELAVGHIREVCEEDELASNDKYLCLSNPEVRRLLAIKIKESLEDFKDIDGYIYSFHESSTSTYSHICDECRDYPDRFQNIQWLHQTVKSGIEALDADIEVIPRLWGINHPASLGREKIDFSAEFCDNDPSFWYCRRPTSRKLFCYQPEPTNRKLKDYAKEEDLTLVYKATWGDYTLNQPMNRWANQYGKARQIIELSLEHCVGGAHIPLIISKQHQDFIKKTQSKNISYAVVPVNWGRICKADTKTFDADPAKWGLNKLNLTVLNRLLENSELDLSEAIREELQKQYNIDCGEKFPKLLLQTAKIMDMSLNINGISTVMNLDYITTNSSFTLMSFVSMLLWYGPMHDDWQERLSTDEANSTGILSRLAETLPANKKLNTEAKEAIDSMKTSEEIKTEFREFFNNFKDLTSILAVSRQRLWLQFKIQSTHKTNFKDSKKLDELLGQERKWIAASKYLQDIFNGSSAKTLGWAK